MAARKVHQGLGRQLTVGLGGSVNLGGVLDQFLPQTSRTLRRRSSPHASASSTLSSSAASDTPRCGAIASVYSKRTSRS